MDRDVGWNECEYVYKKPLNEYMIITTTTYVLVTSMYYPHGKKSP